MVVMDSGRVEDRPWGTTLAMLGIGGRTGELTLRSAGGAVHRIAFVHGVVVGATSPVTSDAVARIAVKSRLVTAGQVATLVRHRRNPRGTEIDAFVTALGLAAEQVQQLKHAVLVQRAARTFSIAHGEYEVADRISIPVMMGIGVDIRAVSYHGARLVLDGERLTADLRRLGTRFVLTAGDDELSRFGFEEAERRVVEALRAGTSVAELDARQRDLDPRMVQAVIYSLAACGGAAQADAPVAAPVASPVAASEQPSPRAPEPTELSACVPMLIGSDPVVARPAYKPTMPIVARPPALPPQPRVARPPTVPRPPSVARPPRVPRPPIVARPPTVAATPIALGRGTRRWTEPFLEVRPTRVRPNALSARELRGLIAAGSTMLEQGVDHFTMLGLPIGASVEAVRIAYLELARNLRPERMAELQVRDQGFHARALLAQLAIAYTVLTEPERRAEYIVGLKRCGVSGADAIDFAKLAAEAYQRGKRALNDNEPDLAVAELRTACELAPDDIGYVATLGHAEFIAKRPRTGD